VLAEPIARSLDLDNNGVVKQAIKQCCGDDGVTKNLAPFGEAAVRSEDHRAFFIAGVDQLEEQIAAAGHDREVTNLVDDKEGGAGEEPQALAQGAFAFGFCEGGDNVGERGERDALSSLHGLDRERRREMALAGAGRTSVIMPGVWDLRLRSSTRSIRDAERQSSLSPASGLGVRRILLSDNLTPR